MKEVKGIIKKVIMYLLTASFVISMSVNMVMAQTISSSSIRNEIIISPFYENTSTIIIRLSYDGTTAKCYTYIEGLRGTTSISAVLTLERENADGTTTYLTSWSGSTSSDFFEISKTYTVTKGYTYRLTLDTTVKKGSTSENIINSVKAKCE